MRSCKTEKIEEIVQVLLCFFQAGEMVLRDTNGDTMVVFEKQHCLPILGINFEWLPCFWGDYFYFLRTFYLSNQDKALTVETPTKYVANKDT